MFKNMGCCRRPCRPRALHLPPDGVVDAGENDPASVVSWGWVDVIKFYSLNEHSISAT